MWGSTSARPTHSSQLWNMVTPACWPAGKPIAHAVTNRSATPCTYLIVGTRVTHDACHYAESGRVLFTEGEEWRIEDSDGKVLKSGRCKSPPGRD